MPRLLLRLAVLFGIVAIAATAPAADWPQWMGPTRDGVWAETGIVTKFPEGGPKKLWSTPIAGGYAGPAVADGKVYVHDYARSEGDAANNPAVKSALQGRERVHCLDAKTGKPLWKHEYDCPYKVSYPAGPRCTPTVDGDRVYTLGAMGNLYCLDTATGKSVWSKDFKTDYAADTPIWGFAGHPLVHGSDLICLVGGTDGALVVAFDKATGKEHWRALDTPATDGPGYCPPTLLTAGGTTHLVVWDPQALHGLDPATGKERWSVPLVPKYGMSIMAPRAEGNMLFAGGIGGDSACVKLGPGETDAEVVWRGNMRTAISPVNVTPIVDAGIIYGIDQPGMLRAVKLADGTRLWSTFRPLIGDAFDENQHDDDYRGAGSGTAFLVKNGDRYFLFAETGDLIIAKLTPNGYTEIDRANLIPPTGEAFGRKVVWSFPAFADQCVFARNDKEIACFSLAAE